MLARAYGVAPPRSTTAPAFPAPGGPAARAATVTDSASISGVRAPETAGRIAQAAPAASLDRLVAARVPGKVSFDGDVASLSAPGAYTMHGRPADRNAAATGVQTGRSLDISG